MHLCVSLHVSKPICIIYIVFNPCIKPIYSIYSAPITLAAMRPGDVTGREHLLHSFLRGSPDAQMYRLAS